MERPTSDPAIGAAEALHLALPGAGRPALTLDVALLEAVAAGTDDAADAADGEGVGEARLQAAAAAYRGPFLAGVTFDDAPEFEAWVGAQRVYWQDQVERV